MKRDLEVVVVTGRSGAGKTTAVNALEDLGYYSVDNLPTPVLEATLEALRESGERKVALGIDVRARAYLESAVSVLDRISARGDTALTIVYLDSSEELLLRRFNATRRPHPLTAGARHSVRAPLDGIRLEAELLSPLRARAGLLIDSTSLSVHDLRRQVIQLVGREDAQSMLTRIVSFGFKYGAPHDADLLFDVRFLPNPYFVEHLRPQSGQDEAVRNYVLSSPEALEFLEKLRALVEFCLPRFEAEGKSYVTIGIGCTGGRHRSVAVSDWLAQELAGSAPGSIEAAHRDVRNHDHLGL